MGKSQRAILKRTIKIHIRTFMWTPMWEMSSTILSRYGLITVTRRNGIWSLYLKDKEFLLFGDFNKMFDFLCEKLK